MASEALSPETESWVDIFKRNTPQIDELQELELTKFEIKANGGVYNSHGTTSVIKVNDGGNWIYVWGFSTQLNMKQRLEENNYI